MEPMIGILASQRNSMADELQATTNFELGCAKIWFSDFKSEPKLTLLMAMAPYLLLLPNSFISP
jgi:hypothetical protein